MKKNNTFQKLKAKYRESRELDATQRSGANIRTIMAQYLARKLLYPYKLHKDTTRIADLTDFLVNNGQVHGHVLKIPYSKIENSPHKDIIYNDSKIDPESIANREKFIANKLPQVKTLFANPEHNAAALEALRHIKHYNMPINQKEEKTRNWKDLQEDAAKDEFHPLNHTYIDDGETKLTGKQIIEKLLASKQKLPSGKSGISFNLTKDQSPKEIDPLKRRMGLIKTLRKLKDYSVNEFNKLKAHGVDDLKDAWQQGKTVAGKYAEASADKVRQATKNFLTSDIEAPLANKSLEKLDSGADKLNKPTNTELGKPFDHYGDAVEGLGNHPHTKELLQGIDNYVTSKKDRGLKVDPNILNRALNLLSKHGIYLTPDKINVLMEYAKNNHYDHILDEPRPNPNFNTRFNSVQHHFNLKPGDIDRRQTIKRKFKKVYDELMAHQNQNGGKIAKDAYNSILDKHFGRLPAVKEMMDKAIREGFTKNK